MLQLLYQSFITLKPLQLLWKLWNQLLHLLQAMLRLRELMVLIPLILCITLLYQEQKHLLHLQLYHGSLTQPHLHQLCQVMVLLHNYLQLHTVQVLQVFQVLQVLLSQHLTVPLSQPLYLMQET